MQIMPIVIIITNPLPIANLFQNGGSFFY